MGLQCESPGTGAVLYGFAWTVHSVSPSSFIILLCFTNFYHALWVLEAMATALRSFPERTSYIFMSSAKNN